MIHLVSREVHRKGDAMQKALVVLHVDAALTTQSHAGTAKKFNAVRITRFVTVLLECSM